MSERPLAALAGGSAGALVIGCLWTVIGVVIGSQTALFGGALLTSVALVVLGAVSNVQEAGAETVDLPEEER
jgi:hypothetical protein